MVDLEILPDYVFGVEITESYRNAQEKVRLIRKLRYSFTKADWMSLKTSLHFKNIFDEDAIKSLRKKLQEMEIQLNTMCFLFVRCERALSYFAESVETDAVLVGKVRSYLDAFSDLEYVSELLELSKTSRDAQEKLRALTRPYRTEMIVLSRIMLEQTNLILREEQDGFAFSLDGVI